MMVGICETIRLFFPGKPKWSPKDMPDLSEQVCIVTGGNTGIGKETVKELLLHNAKVYLAARSTEKAMKAIEDLRKETGKEAVFLKMDLANLKSVKAAAEEFLREENRLHVLFNNGGVMGCPMDYVTDEGYDLQFATNVLGHYYFTKLLLPIMISTTKSSPDGKTRVVNTSSMGHLATKEIDYATLKDGPARRKLSPMALYSQSKFGNILFANELGRRYGGDGIVSTSVHPGNLKTELNRYASQIAVAAVGWLLLYPAPWGAYTQLWAGTSREGANFNGKYLIAWAKFGQPRPETQSEQAGATLWKWLEEQVSMLD